MLGELIGELALSMLGEAIVGSLFPGLAKPQPSPPEGEWNASLGSLAAFVAVIAAMFCGISALGVLNGARDTLSWPILGSSLIVAVLSGALARRAIEVTQRRRALARIGLWLSRATIVVGLVAAVAALAGVDTAWP